VNAYYKIKTVPLSREEAEYALGIIRQVYPELESLVDAGNDKALNQFYDSLGEKDRMLVDSVYVALHDNSRN
jgi:hypothetical protein